MKEFVLKRITNKEWVQNQIIELIVDVQMLVFGLVLGYYILINIKGL